MSRVLWYAALTMTEPHLILRSITDKSLYYIVQHTHNLTGTHCLDRPGPSVWVSLPTSAIVITEENNKKIDCSTSRLTSNCRQLLTGSTFLTSKHIRADTCIHWRTRVGIYLTVCYRPQTLPVNILTGLCQDGQVRDLYQSTAQSEVFGHQTRWKLSFHDELRFWRYNCILLVGINNNKSRVGRHYHLGPRLPDNIPGGRPLLTSLMSIHWSHSDGELDMKWVLILTWQKQEI